ncbi:transposase family protein [Streptomyces sp. NPDC005492]|uniref:transposase family protein n=1 Tax=Streptomyces sp. NPDC005492 TaxID=3156883 RepID=UPI0033B7EDE2
MAPKVSRALCPVPCPPRFPRSWRSSGRSTPIASPTCAPYLESVPGPRSRRGRWYSLASILAVCACTTVSGAKTIDEIAEWGARARHWPACGHRHPSPPAQMATRSVVGHDRAGAGGRRR